MTPEQVLSNLKELRDNLQDVVIEATEASAINMLSEIIVDIQLNNKLGREYSEGYKRTRERAGRQTDYVDLTFSGDMLRGIRTSEAIVSDTLITVGFEMDREFDFKKYEWMNARFKDFIQPNDEQVEGARLDASEYFENKVNEILNKQ